MEAQNHRQTHVQTLADSLEKPLLDNRTYRVVKLPNNLEALLIHDPDTDKASAALDNHAGAMSDEKDMPGMAHAVEHALFMGTKKYPEENEYSRYLTAHSGYSNAFTASTSTNYFFEVAAQASGEEKAEATNGTTSKYPSSPLYGALDRFAQFFVAPLFLEATLDRELKAVDSENKKNLQSDMWRQMQLGRSLCNPKHPNNHFATGNLQTLRDEPLARGVKIRNEFMRFHDEQYSANRMKLVVLGRESLDTLQSWVEELFADVKNKNLPENRWDGIPIYTEKELLDEIRVTPVMESRSINLSFPWLDEDALFAEQPGRYFSHLIGHEGPGSILSYIKAKGWANSLSAGEHTISPETGIFTIDIRLTPDGLKNYKEVVKVVFQYISILKENAPSREIFDEIKRMTEVDFRFKQKSAASSTTSRLSQVMQKPLPRDRLLSGESVITNFDSDLIKKALSHLNADNFRMMIVAPEAVEGEALHEKYYNTEYTINKIPEDFLSEIKKAYNSSANERLAELSLPAKNEFIPSKLEVEKKEISQPSKTPKLIRTEQNLRLWYKKDDQFWVPKGSVNVLLRNPLCGVTARDAVIASIYTELVEDSLSEYAYNAEIAGLNYRLDNPTIGLSIQVNGYSDKMSVLLEKVLSTMKSLEVKQDRFDVIKERMMRGWKNSEFQPPYHQITMYTRWLSSEHAWVTANYLSELPAITAEDVRSFQAVLLRQFHIEALVHGNVHREDALKMADVIQSALTPAAFPPSQWTIRRAIDFPEGSNYVYERALADPKQVNHAISYVLTIGDKTDKLLHAQLLLLCQMTHEPAFNQLRTKEQLGYVVFSGHVTQVTNEAFRVLIQSERTPEHLESRIEAFLAQFRATLAEMSQDEFDSHKSSLTSERMEKLKNLNEEGSRFWHHIQSEVYHFQQREDDVEALKGVTKEDMLAFYDRFINPDSGRRRKLSVYLRAQAGTAVEDGEAGEGAEKNEEKLENSKPIKIEDVREFKATLPLTKGAKPISELSIFEETEAKL
jgi:insulysin